MDMARGLFWFDTSLPAGIYPVMAGEGTGCLRFGDPLQVAVAPMQRRIHVEASVPAEALRRSEAIGSPWLPAGCAVEVLRLNDPDLERLVLGLEEAEAAGLFPGGLWYMPVLLGAEGMARAAFADAERARAFLEDEIAEASRHGGAGHWEAMLDGTHQAGGAGPALQLTAEGPEVIDGLHRLAGLVANGAPGTPAILGIPEGRALSDCPGAVLSGPGTAYPDWEGPGPAPRP